MRALRKGRRTSIDMVDDEEEGGVDSDVSQLSRLRFLRALREGRRTSIDMGSEEEEEGVDSAVSRLKGTYKRIYLGLTNSDESIQMLSLDDICCTLATANEYSLSGFSPKIFVPLLLKFVKTKKHNGNMMLIAVRALTHIIDIVQSISSIAVSHDAVGILCETLNNIEYIDVAEQSMKCLKLLANDHPSSILNSNGISSVLTYIDFFSINTQRQAVATAALACKKLRPSEDQFKSLIKDSLQSLTNLVKCSDQQIVESATTCFFRIVNTFKNDELILKEIVKYGLLTQLIAIVANISNDALSRQNNANSSNKNTIHSSNTQSLAVKLLTLLSKNSTEIGLLLVDNDLPNVLSRVLTNQPVGSEPLRWVFHVETSKDGSDVLKKTDEGNAKTPSLKKAKSFTPSSTTTDNKEKNDSMQVARTKSSPNAFLPAMSPPAMSSSTQVYDFLLLIDALLPTVPVELNHKSNNNNEDNSNNRTKHLKRKKNHISRNSNASPISSSSFTNSDNNSRNSNTSPMSSSSLTNGDNKNKKKVKHDNNVSFMMTSLDATTTSTTTTTTTAAAVNNNGDAIEQNEPNNNNSSTKPPSIRQHPYKRSKALVDITTPKNAHLLLKLAQTMLPSLLYVYSSVASVSVCTLCLSILHKILYWMQGDDLKNLLGSKSQQSQLSEFFASLLSQSDLQIVLLALKMCLDTLKKAREYVSDRFLRDGIITQIKDFSKGFGKAVTSNNKNKNIGLSNINNRGMMISGPMSPSSRGMSPARAAAYAARYQRVTVEAIAVSFLHLYFNEKIGQEKLEVAKGALEGGECINSFANVSHVMQRLIDVRKSIENIMSEMMPLPKHSSINNRSPLGDNIGNMNHGSINSITNTEATTSTANGSRRKSKRTKRMRVNLSPHSNNETANIESRYTDILLTLKDIFLEDASVSTYELINSRIVDGLYEYLTHLRSFEIISASVSPANSTDSRTSMELQQQTVRSSFSTSSPELNTLRFKDRLCRIKIFLNVFFTSHYQKKKQSESKIPLVFLLERFQAAVASCERFPTYLKDLSKPATMKMGYQHRIFGSFGASHHRSGRNNRNENKIDQGLALLASPLRIQLIRMPVANVKDKKIKDGNGSSSGSSKKLNPENQVGKVVDAQKVKERKHSFPLSVPPRRKKTRDWQDEGVTVLIEPMASAKSLSEFLLQRLNDDDDDDESDSECDDDDIDHAYDRLQKIIKMQTKSIEKKISTQEDINKKQLDVSDTKMHSSSGSNGSNGSISSNNADGSTTTGDNSSISTLSEDKNSLKLHEDVLETKSNDGSGLTVDETKKSSSSSSEKKKVKTRYKREHIYLYINGYKIHPSCTVIEAIAKSGGKGNGYVSEDSMMEERSGSSNLNRVKRSEPPNATTWNIPHVIYYKILGEKPILNVNAKHNDPKVNSNDIPVSPRRVRPKRKQPTPVTPDFENLNEDEYDLFLGYDDRLNTMAGITRFERALVKTLRSELAIENLINYYVNYDDNHNNYLDNQFSANSPSETKKNTITLLMTLIKIFHNLCTSIDENNISSIIKYSSVGVESKVTGKEIKKEDYQSLDIDRFYNSKLASKLMHQTQDPLSVCSRCLPTWCSPVTQKYHFFFPFEIRRQYFYASAFSPHRSMQYMLNQAEARGQSVSSSQKERMTRIERVKVSVMRDRILEAAKGLFLKITNRSTTIDVEFNGEVGTGEGPTMEFFTLVAKEFHAKKLSLWIDTNSNAGDSKYCFAPQGLYPSPFTDSLDELEATRRRTLYKVLGRFIGQALVDRRLLALSLSPLLLRSICNCRDSGVANSNKSRYKYGNGVKKSVEDLLSDLKLIDTALCKQMNKLYQVAKEYKRIQSDTSLTLVEKNTMIQELNIDGAKIEQLCLNFTVPGFDDVEVMKNGSSVEVTIMNLEEYVRGVCRVMVDETLSNVMPSITEGLSGIVDVFYLSSFTCKEMDMLICGTKALFTKVYLDNHLLYDHGYTSTSNAVVLLREILAEFNSEEQEKFLSFVTGSPRLPYEGLAGLSPRLTVVRKAPMDSKVSEVGVEDSSLPSASTCTNYFKLPDYKLKETMKQKILKAINYGKGAFHLS